MELDDVRGHLLPLLRRVVGSKVELAGFEIGNQRQDYLVLLVHLRRPLLKLVIKLAGPEAEISCSFCQTATIHHMVATQTTIPVPAVVGVDESYQAWPWRYLITRHIPGQEWAVARQRMSADQLLDAQRQIGDAVAQLHGIQFPTFGAITIDGQVRARQPYIRALKERAACIIKNVLLRDIFFSVLEQNGGLFQHVRDASLCHDDVHGHNMLFENRAGEWRLATILDFDKAWAGHHETDLARMEFWSGMTSAPFWQAYSSVRAVDPLYCKRRPIYQLLWCLEYARPTPEHLRDTRRVCLELGVPPVEHF